MPFWSKKASASRYRLFFATDVHGSEPTFRKFINAAKFYKVDALVLGGDITGKMLIPLIAQGDHTFRATLLGKTLMISQDDLPGFETRLAKLGFYSSIMDERQFQEYQNHPHEVEKLYVEKASQRLVSWIELAEERLGGSGVRCYITGGNDDPLEIVEVLKAEAGENVVFCEEKSILLNDMGHTLISLGYSNPTPWRTPREVTEDWLDKRIEQVFHGMDDCSRVIFNMHVPPVDSTLDTCPVLDTSTDPPTVITSGGEPVLFGAGSQAVRKAIEEYQPLLSLHGHIHESRGVVRIGRTVALNPGSEYGEGILRGTIIVLQGDHVESTQMTSG